MIYVNTTTYRAKFGFTRFTGEECVGGMQQTAGTGKRGISVNRRAYKTVSFHLRQGELNMKILLIHGQNHKGSSYHIGRMLAEQFHESEISEFFLPKDLKAAVISTAAGSEPGAGFKTKFMFGIMRLMQVKGLGSSSEETEYWRANGWLDQKRPWNK